MNERKEGKSIGDENRKRMGELARKALVSNGQVYLSQYGEGQVDRDIIDLKADLHAWNIIAPAALRYDINTVNAMLQILATFPIKTGRTELLADPKYAQLTMKLSAIRNRMMKERDDMIAKSNPELSTP